MMRRLLVFAVLLVSLGPAAAAAKHRAVTPGGPSQCVVGTLLPATYASSLTVDDRYVYVIESSELVRVPKTGGDAQLVNDQLDDWLPLAMTVDETTIYISALPFEALFVPTPGVILSVPKAGGVLSVFASGVALASALDVHGEYVYWVAAGLIDFDEGGFTTAGRIERMKKDGSAREVLADNLSSPLGFALDDRDVYFGQSGQAPGNPTIGLYRVSQSGGPVTPINTHVFVGGLDLAQDTIVFIGALAETDDASVFAIAKSGATPLREIMLDDGLMHAELIGTVIVADRRAYVLTEGDFSNDLISLNIDAPGPRAIVGSGLDGDAFALDGCAAIVSTYDGDVVRIAR